MRIFHSSFIICFLSFVVLSLCCNSCGKKAFVEDADTTRGIWGKVALYNEKGEPDGDLTGISVKVRCVDTVSEANGTIFDTTYYINADADGNWELYRPEGGWYFLEFSKKDYCRNAVYAYRHDTSSADTLETIYLSKKTQGSVEIDSIRIADGVLSIYRTLFFTADFASYSLSTWYFFGEDEDVSPDRYKYAYVSGCATAKGGSKQETVVLKPIDKLLENGFAEGSTVYVRAYCDNARAVSYQTGEKTFAFPNILDGSSVVSFEIPEAEE